MLWKAQAVQNRGRKCLLYFICERARAKKIETKTWDLSLGILASWKEKHRSEKLPLLPVIIGEWKAGAGEQLALIAISAGIVSKFCSKSPSLCTLIPLPIRSDSPIVSGDYPFDDFYSAPSSVVVLSEKIKKWDSLLFHKYI